MTLFSLEQQEPDIFSPFQKRPSKYYPFGYVSLPRPSFISSLNSPSYTSPFYFRKMPLPYLDPFAKQPTQVSPLAHWYLPYPWGFPDSYYPLYWSPFQNYSSPLPCLREFLKQPRYMEQPLQQQHPLPFCRLSFHSPSQQSPFIDFQRPKPFFLPKRHSPSQLYPFLQTNLPLPFRLPIQYIPWYMPFLFFSKPSFLRLFMNSPQKSYFAVMSTPFPSIFPFTSLPAKIVLSVATIYTLESRMNYLRSNLGLRGVQAIRNQSRFYLILEILKTGSFQVNELWCLVLAQSMPLALKLWKMMLDYFWKEGEKEETDRDSSSSCFILAFMFPLSLLAIFSMYLYSFLGFMALLGMEGYYLFSLGVCSVFSLNGVICSIEFCSQGKLVSRSCDPCLQ